LVQSIYIAGTSQHAGKTFVSLGLVAALREKGLAVRYMKPVGQRTVHVEGVAVDEDVALIHRVYGMPGSVTAANPITVPRGFTHRFLLGGGNTDSLKEKILAGYAETSDGADVVVVEGTGHAGVGSVLGLSNATVAALLGSRAIVVIGGGIGQPIDEFAINRALFEREQAPLLGVISNKVQASKLEECRSTLPVWFDSIGVPVLGLVPLLPLLLEITLRQVAHEIEAYVLSGEEFLDRRVRKFIIGAAPAHRLLDEFAEGTLVITPGDRDDIILACISSELSAEPSDAPHISALCLTGGVRPQKNVLRIIERSRVPVIASDDGTFNLATRIANLVAKILPKDHEKIRIAKETVGELVDIEAIVARLGGA
jgi:BioD-like phosphotransacetylase family protein